MAFRSRVVGCFLGGAVGDALGGPVEFMSRDAIRKRFGPDGIAAYASAYGRRGAITDDTQMALFTAEGLIRAETCAAVKEGCHTPTIVHSAYLRWLSTQDRAGGGLSFRADGWLVTNGFLHHCRAPGNTCISALQSGLAGRIDLPLNDSKGCGGVMRVAPVGLMASAPFDLGAEVAALTHGHPSGYLAAGALAVMISALARGESPSAAVDLARGELQGREGSTETRAALDRAVEMAACGPGRADCVAELGQGWVAEEALAISVYCALTADGFRNGVLLAVNHDGDSDSTGAITGNLLGTVGGALGIPADLLDELEGREVIEQLAHDFASTFGDNEAPDPERYPPW